MITVVKGNNEFTFDVADIRRVECRLANEAAYVVGIHFVGGELWIYTNDDKAGERLMEEVTKARKDANGQA